MDKFAVVILVSMLAFSNATNVRKCKKGPLPLSVDVKGCTQPPCDITKGTTTVMDIHFLGTRNNITSLKTKTRVLAWAVNAPYPLPQKVANVCLNLLNDASCPINKNEDVVYKFQFYMHSFYPETPLSVEVSLKDENNVSVACFICDIKVKNGAIS